MWARVKKAWTDHVFEKNYDLELRLKLSEAPYRHTAEEHAFSFFIITDGDDPRLEQLARDFPKQSRSFRRDIAKGCLMLVLGDGTQTMGYFFVATADFFDVEQYRLKFPAGDGRVYAYNFYVDPTHRTKPIARVLLAEGFRFLHMQGYTDLYAMCRSSEKALVRLYRQFNLRASNKAVNAYRILHFNITTRTTHMP